jgi:acyl-CoA reductase-like NAD-dependent aldehyde dehydrogenase
METRLLIAGEQVAGGGPGLDVENPYTQATVATVALPSSEQVDAAIGAARAAARGWADTPAVERCELLHEVAARLRASADPLAELMTLEGRKPLVENADALAAGNAVVCKPSELTPLSTLALAPCLDHLPPGVVSLQATGHFFAPDNDAGPFGGFKQSGLGRELGQEGLEALQETKHVHIETKIAAKSWWRPYGASA